MNRRGENFDITLHEAARHNDNPAVVGILLEHGPRFLNSHDGGGGAPLHYAAGRRNIGAAEVLMASGADVNREERWFTATPLQYAVKRDDNADMIALLVSAGADVNKADCAGDTPRHHGGYPGRSRRRDDRSAMIVSLLMTRGVTRYPHRRNEMGPALQEIDRRTGRPVLYRALYADEFLIRVPYIYRPSFVTACYSIGVSRWFRCAIQRVTLFFPN